MESLWFYKIDDGGFGIVVAVDENLARLEVIEAYRKHGGISISNIIAIKKLKPQFEDASKVVELDEYLEEA